MATISKESVFPSQTFLSLGVQVIVLT